MGNTAKKKEQWTKPVSRKFYDEMIEHVAKCVHSVRYKSVLGNIIDILNNYIDTGSKAFGCTTVVEPIVVMLMERDIDKAKERSARARRQAAERKLRIEAEKKAKEEAERKAKEEALAAASAPDGVGEESAVEQGTAEGDLVGVLDLVADGNTARKLGDAHVGVGSEAPVKVEVGGLPLHRCAQGQNDLMDLSGGDAPDKGVDLKLVGSDSVHRRNDTAKHMVETAVLPGVLETHHVLDTLDHADRRSVAALIGTDRTDLCLGNVVTERTVADTPPHSDDRLAESHARLLVAAENVESETQSGFPPDSGQTRKFGDGTFEKF